jgi:hypothetical protein
LIDNEGQVVYCHQSIATLHGKRSKESAEFREHRFVTNALCQEAARRDAAGSTAQASTDLPAARSTAQASTDLPAAAPAREVKAPAATDSDSEDTFDSFTTEKSRQPPKEEFSPTSSSSSAEGTCEPGARDYLQPPPGSGLEGTAFTVPPPGLLHFLPDPKRTAATAAEQPRPAGNC